MPDESELRWKVPHQKKNFLVAAARNAGMSLESWVLKVCMEAVKNDPDPIKVAAQGSKR